MDGLWKWESKLLNLYKNIIIFSKYVGSKPLRDEEDVGGVGLCAVQEVTAG